MKDLEDEDSESGFSGRALVGMLCLYASAAVLFLAVVDASSSLSFMPRSWYSNRWAWYLVAFLGFFASLILLKSKPPGAVSAGTIGTKAFARLVLYTRSGCHLCDDARDLLARFETELPAIEEVDISSDPELVRRFDTCVPVVEIDGKIRFRGKVNEVLLRRLIDGAGETADDILERSA